MDQIEGLSKQPWSLSQRMSYRCRIDVRWHGGSGSAEAFLDGLQHHVSDVRTGYPGIGDGCPRDDLPVKRVEMNARRTASPFQQVNSRPSQYQRRFDRITMTLPSWTRPLRTAVCFSRIMAWLAMMR